MDIHLSERVRAIKPSPTIAVTMRAAEMRAAGRDVIGLGAGEPDFDTPEHIKAAARKAIDDGFTKYTAVDGTAELKAAVARKLERENGLTYAPDQIVVSAGAKHSIYNLLQAVVDPGDEVIVPAPYWVSYTDMTVLTGGVPVVVEAGINAGFKISPEQLAGAITPRTRLLMLNSPSNPTGACYTRTELEELGDVLRAHPAVLVATDDIYEHIWWASEPFYNIVSACPDLASRAVVINGVSKAYAMTGWRIGYAASPKPLAAAMRKVQSQSTSNPTSISQVAAAAALDGDQGCVADMVEVFHQRHDYVVGRLNRIRGVNCLSADGAFYAFPDVRVAIAGLEGVADDVALSEHLIEHAGVAVVPGSAFGAPGYVRLSFATSMENLEKALDRMEQALGTA